MEQKYVKSASNMCEECNYERKVSDDLISRKEAIDILENMIFEVGKDLSKSYLLQDAREKIIGLNTAFDKEKVIDQLKEEGCIIDDEPGNRAVEIIAKGGIEK